MCRCCRLCWEDFYWNCIEEKFCFDENIVNYDPEEDEHYVKKQPGIGFVPELETSVTREKVGDAICSQPTRRRNSIFRTEEVREVQMHGNVLAPEILAAFASSQIFHDKKPTSRALSPLAGIHQSHSTPNAQSEELLKRLEGIKVRKSSESSIPQIVADEQDSSSKASTPDLCNFKPINKNLQLEAPYFSFRPASCSDIFTISDPSSGRISTTPEVPSVSFSQLPKNYADTPTIGQYRESKSLYEIQTAGIKDQDYSMPRYYTKSHLMVKPRLAEDCSSGEQTPRRIEKSKRLKNIRMQLPPLMIHSSNSSIDRSKEGKRQTRS